MLMDGRLVRRRGFESRVTLREAPGGFVPSGAVLTQPNTQILWQRCRRVEPPLPDGAPLFPSLSNLISHLPLKVFCLDPGAYLRAGC